MPGEKEKGKEKGRKDKQMRKNNPTFYIWKGHGSLL